MDGEKQAHGQNRHQKHYIVHGILGSAGGIEGQAQARADDQGWDSIDFHDLPQANLEQLQYKVRSLEKRVGQQAMVAVHEQRLGKAGAPVDEVHDEGEIRKPSHHHLVDIRFGAGLYGHEQ